MPLDSTVPLIQKGIDEGATLVAGGPGLPEAAVLQCWRGAAALQARLQLRLQQMDEGAHVVDGAVAQKRHRTVRNTAFGFHLAPPHTAVTQTNAVHTQGF